jgi:MerR family transcriptional regulator, light-induced transcriptional regulator
MAHYSIKDLEKLSGIQAHTIRIWEKRYQLVHPERTDTNIRVYNDMDLKRLLNVALLNKNGLKISKISRLNDKDLIDKVLKLSADYSNMQNQVDNLVLAMIDLDEEKFESLIENLIHQNGFDKTITSVIYPFLVRIGVLWQTGNINAAQEHFVSNIIRRKIIVAIDKLGPTNSANKQVFISFLPEWEYHEIGLLFYSYLIKKNGFHSVYLGQSVPISDLLSIQNAYNAGNLFVSFTTALPETTIFDYLTVLSKSLKKGKIYVAGAQITALEFKKGSNIIKLKSPENFEEILQKLK